MKIKKVQFDPVIVLDSFSKNLQLNGLVRKTDAHLNWFLSEYDVDYGISWFYGYVVDESVLCRG